MIRIVSFVILILNKLEFGLLVQSIYIFLIDFLNFII